MAPRRGAFSRFLIEIIQNWREDDAPRLAAALAFYTTFSLAPLVILTVSIAGLILRDDRRALAEIAVQVEAIVGRPAADMVVAFVETPTAAADGAIAGAVSIVMLLLGATGVFGQLKYALDTIWRVEAGRERGIRRLIKGRLISFLMVVGVSFVLLLSLAFTAAVSFLGGRLANFVGPLNVAVSLGMVTLVFAAIFKVLPDLKVAWRDVWAGAFTTAVLFTIGKEILGVYLGRSSMSSMYGAAGSLVVILAWIYYSAQILLFGAEITQALAVSPLRVSRRLCRSRRAHRSARRRRLPPAT